MGNGIEIWGVPEVLARFDKVWTRLAEVNAEFSEDEIAADIKAARQG